MTEELKPMEGESRVDGSGGVGNVDRRSEIGPLESLENVSEKVVEGTGERYREILSKTAAQQGSAVTTADSAVIEVDAKAIYDETDAEARVAKLVSLAEAKGVEHAVRVAQKLNDFYVLDRMHDELSGKFYDALKAKGLITE